MAEWIVNGRTIDFGYKKTEHKADVLRELLRASWMRDAGWSDFQIAEHYQADRNHRAAVVKRRRANG